MMTRKHFKQIANVINELYLYDSKYNDEGKKRLFNNLQLVNKTKLINELSIVFKKLNPGVSDRFDEFNREYSIDNCNNSKKNPTYREYGDKSTDGTGRETDTFYCTFLN